MDLALAVALAVLGLVGAAWPGETVPLRLVVGGPLVLVIPGYALSMALLPHPLLDWPTRLVLTAGLSLACLAVGGLVLNATPFGLNVVTWAAYVALITLIGVVVAVIRSRGVPAEKVAAPASRHVTARQLLVIAGAELVLLASMWVARLPIPEQPQQGYTLLWAVPGGGGQPNTIQLGVRSLEPVPVNYHLQIISGDQTLREVAVSLSPADEWNADFALPDGGSGTYEALLYRDDAPGLVYRRVLVHIGGAT